MVKMKNLMKVIMINQTKMKEAINMTKIEPDLTEREVEKKILDIVEIAEKKINTGVTTEIDMKIEIGEIKEIIEIVTIKEIEEIIEIGKVTEIGVIIEIREEKDVIIEIAIGIEAEIMNNIQKEMKNKKIQIDMAREVIKILSWIKKIAIRMNHKEKIVKKTDN